MIEPDELLAMLRTAFPDAQIRVEDLTGSKDHYRATISTAAFEGKPLVQRHRAVYAALGDAMKQRIHALTLETTTPAEQPRRL